MSPNWEPKSIQTFTFVRRHLVNANRKQMCCKCTSFRGMHIETDEQKTPEAENNQISAKTLTTVICRNRPQALKGCRSRFISRKPLTAVALSTTEVYNQLISETHNQLMSSTSLSTEIITHNSCSCHFVSATDCGL